MTKYCRLCRDEIPIEEAWSEHCKKCRKRINEELSKLKRIGDFLIPVLITISILGKTGFGYVVVFPMNDSKPFIHNYTINSSDQTTNHGRPFHIKSMHLYMGIGIIVMILLILGFIYIRSRWFF